MKKRLPKSRTIHKGLNLAATVKKGYANEPPVRTKAVWFGTTTGGVHPCASMQKRTARGVLAGVLTSDVQFLPLRRCGTIHYFSAAIPITINIVPTNTAIATPEYNMP